MEPDNETPVARQWRLLRLLATRSGLGVEEAAAELEVSTKTIRRDLDVLRSAGFELAAEVTGSGRKSWRLAQEPDPFSFSPDEAAAFGFAELLMRPIEGTYLGAAAARAIAKVESRLGTAAACELGKLRAAIRSTDAEGGGGPADEIIDAVLLATEETRELSIRYRSESAPATPRGKGDQSANGQTESDDRREPDRPVWRTIRPYGVVWHRGQLYAVADCRFRKAVRTFKLTRIAEAVVQPERFERTGSAVDLEAVLAGAFGVWHDERATLQRVRVWFAPEAARYVTEGRWHASQQLLPQSDGSVIAEFLLTGCSELQAWVLSFGPRAELLEPPEARKAIRRELDAARGRYACQ